MIPKKSDHLNATKIHNNHCSTSLRSLSQIQLKTISYIQTVGTCVKRRFAEDSTRRSGKYMIIVTCTVHLIIHHSNIMISNNIDIPLLLHPQAVSSSALVLLVDGGGGDYEYDIADDTASACGWRVWMEEGMSVVSSSSNYKQKEKQCRRHDAACGWSWRRIRRR